jgi:hypothetical protein
LLQGDFAIPGVSKSRENKTFSALKRDQNLKASDEEARCETNIMDLKSQDVVH